MKGNLLNISRTEARSKNPWSRHITFTPARDLMELVRHLEHIFLDGSSSSINSNRKSPLTVFREPIVYEVH